MRQIAGKYGLDGSIVGWIWTRIRHRLEPRASASARLAVLERIHLAPRQSLALVEVEGRKLLVATSPDGAPTFYALGGLERRDVFRRPLSARAQPGRILC